MNSLFEMLEKTANLYPDKIAIQTIDNSITFSKLVELSKKIAKKIDFLANFKQNIGIYCTQSLETLAMFFAVIYSGNAYVMLDSFSPQERLKKIIENSNINYTLKYENGEYVLDKVHDAHKTHIAENKNITDLLYIVYTSGSTGIPKGIAKSHLSMLSFIESFTKEFDISHSDTIANQTPFYFDASSKDIYTMCYTGATLVIIPKEYFSMPTKLIEFMNATNTTIISWVPSALSIVVQLNTFAYIKPTTLKKVFFVGEVFPIKYLNKWIQEMPNLEYYNLYGSSEIAGIACYYKVTGLMPENSALPIGKSFGNSNAFLIDANGNKIHNQNCEGEICIGGAILSNGYYGDLEKTNKIFIQNPLNDKFREIIYKSGDIAVLDENNNFVFKGRVDHQIKHMGQRIELGEIECACQSLNTIKECCAIYDDIRKKIILIYSAFKNAVENNLKEELKKLLPNYMLPNKYIVVDIMPKNANGKTNRTLLKEKYL